MGVLLAARAPEMVGVLVAPLKGAVAMLLELDEGRLRGNVGRSRVRRVGYVMGRLRTAEVVVLVLQSLLGGHRWLRGRRAPPVRRLGRPEGICETQVAGSVVWRLNSGNFERFLLLHR